MKVSEAVSLALMKFKLELETLGVIVDTNRDLYNPRLPKRTGKAKTDMPCNLRDLFSSWWWSDFISN